VVTDIHIYEYRLMTLIPDVNLQDNYASGFLNETLHITVGIDPSSPKHILDDHIM